MLQSRSRRGQASIMNSIITFCIFGAILIQNGASAQFEGIRSLQSMVESVSRDLLRYNQNLIPQLNTKLSNMKIIKMANIDSMVNSALSNAKIELTLMENGGTNAEHCYELTRQQLDDARNATFSALDKCINDQLDTLKPDQQNIESYLKSEKSLLSHLDEIVLACTSKNALQEKLCVSQHMPTASQTVQNFQSDADLLKNMGNSLSSAGETNANHCFQTSTNDLYADITSKRIYPKNCVSM